MHNYSVKPVQSIHKERRRGTEMIDSMKRNEIKD